MLHTVVMAGGSGTRFWPASRKTHPKQFLTLFGEQTLIQQTVLRCAPIAPAGERTWVVTGTAHAVETARQLPEIPSQRILVEPCARNTAPCVGLAAACLLAEDPDAVMLVTPADHVIDPNEDFLATVERAVATVEQNPDKLCTFGVVSDRPATGYGYIKPAEPLAGADRVFSVKQFREKPDLETAKQFVADGLFWNSGIFVWRADTILKCLAEYVPGITEQLGPIREAWGTPGFAAALEEQFPQMPSISIDYAVLEHSSEVCALEAPFNWDDVGSWSALPRLNPQDESGNTVLGQHVSLDSKNCTVFSSDDHLVTTIGLDDCLVVHTPASTLVARLEDDAQINALLKQIEASGLREYL